MKKLILLLAMLLIPTSANALGHDWQSLEPPTTWERAWVEHAMKCGNAKKRDRDPEALLKLLRLETHPEIKVPKRWRGMILAASCNESGYRANARGDGGESVGIMQIRSKLVKKWIAVQPGDTWKSFAKRYDVSLKDLRKWNYKKRPFVPGQKMFLYTWDTNPKYPGHWGRCNYFDRTDRIGNARCWLWRIRTIYRSRGYKKCKEHGWTSAWVWIAVGPKARTRTYPRIKPGDTWETFAKRNGIPPEKMSDLKGWWNPKDRRPFIPGRRLRVYTDHPAWTCWENPPKSHFKRYRRWKRKVHNRLKKYGWKK